MRQVTPTAFAVPHPSTPSSGLIVTASLKASIRKHMIDTRTSLPASEWQSLSARIVECLTTCLPPSLQNPVALYYPVRGEADVLPLMQYIPACLPVTREASKELVFRRSIPGQHLERNRHGVMQPDASAPLCHPDILIVPLVAFDRAGHRIGYGGGYYDITLASLHKKKKITAIGAAFAFQEVQEVPKEPFDTRLDMIVTEQEILSFP